MSKNEKIKVFTVVMTMVWLVSALALDSVSLIPLIMWMVSTVYLVMFLCVNRKYLKKKGWM